MRLKSRTIDFIVGGIDGFIRHKTKRHAALLAHYGFLLSLIHISEPTRPY